MWLLAQTMIEPGRHEGPHGRPPPRQRASWRRVMCLSGLDYFSTLGYQPAIAVAAAGALAPLATTVLVLVTLAGALPVYRRVAQESPDGAGSIAMLARSLPQWRGKLAVLTLLGFAATDFVITMTLSASDATAHLIENPFAPAALRGENVVITLALVAALGVVFLKGFGEAIRVATVLVTAFLTLSAAVIAVSLTQVARHPAELSDWWTALTTQHGNPVMVVAVAVIVFPKLALGLSGFETGVAVMPQIRAAGDDVALRIRGAQRLLTTSALIMSAFVLTSAICVAALVPIAELEPGGSADGRALAYLAHELIGPAFGTAYDLVTVAILWFAGASAMAGLLNLIPRYLPPYGMAPTWTRATRPLVLVLVAVACVVIVIFDADVTAQAGAYATGVLVLITSAALAATLSASGGRRTGFAVITAVFAVTTAVNMIERPDGVRIAAVFIVGIVAVSLLSRAVRSTELRAVSVTLDPIAEDFARSATGGILRLIAHEPTDLSARRYREKLRNARLAHGLPDDDVVFIEVTVTDSSDFETDLVVHGSVRHGYRVLAVEASTVPNALAAVTLHLQHAYHCRPHLYFRWSEGKPVVNLLRFFVLGEGAISSLTREVLREAEPALARRPWVHVA